MSAPEYRANALLIGGPLLIPEAVQLRSVNHTHDEVKLRYGDRYEHFEPTGELIGINRQLTVFRWSYFTKAAE